MLKSTLEGNEAVMQLAIRFSYLTLCKLQKVGEKISEISELSDLSKFSI